jgi:DNA (cytosine-5)-methyltransferase 1
MSTIRFIDLFAGIGGLRLGFEQGFKSLGLETECVMTSEIKPHAIASLRHNFTEHSLVGDIARVDASRIPDFDFLLGGFPCQPFSAGGKRQGFVDTRGTLFFEIERILEAKRPEGFILENVEGLVRHDPEHRNDPIGRTLRVILDKLAALGYTVTWEVLNAEDFGLPQARKRVFIVGMRNAGVSLRGFSRVESRMGDILEKGLPTMDTAFTRALLKHLSIKELCGKSIKDKRGGDNNIHSWDIGLKGEVSKEQAVLLNRLFRERRKKKWAAEHGIKWMDGMPLTLDQIATFHPSPQLREMLDDLVRKGYLRFEHPKALVTTETLLGTVTERREDTRLKPGYNIVTGKLSFEINKVLGPNDVAPTLVATDMARLAVVDGQGLRRMTLREGLRLFGYPEWFDLPVSVTEGYDLLGNTVAVSVVQAIAERVASAFSEAHAHQEPAQYALDNS